MNSPDQSAVLTLIQPGVLTSSALTPHGQDTDAELGSTAFVCVCVCAFVCVCVCAFLCVCAFVCVLACSVYEYVSLRV